MGWAAAERSAAVTAHDSVTGIAERTEKHR